MNAILLSILQTKERHGVVVEKISFLRERNLSVLVELVWCDHAFVLNLPDVFHDQS
jgi:hypothetical protein